VLKVYGRPWCRKAAFIGAAKRGRAAEENPDFVDTIILRF
jgi:hypothetical protein